MRPKMNWKGASSMIVRQFELFQVIPEPHTLGEKLLALNPGELSGKDVLDSLVPIKK